MIIPLALFPLIILGCGGDSASVSGTVTYKDVPVEKGNIAFYPAEGKGQSAGGEIINGKYTVKGVTLGKNRVEITSSAKMKGPPPSGMADSIKNPPALDLSTVISTKATGNNAIHEITSSTTLDFALKPAVATDGKEIK
ncbi:hypothetical protein [Fimbriiglobus ruber]|nr:hypothetical protein [Fimbriiglobus ruber]